MTDERDRGLIRRFIADWPGRWGTVSPELKAKVVKGLDTASDEVEDLPNLKDRIDARVSIAKTVAMIEGQRQKDDHKAVDVLAAEREAQGPALPQVSQVNNTQVNMGTAGAVAFARELAARLVPGSNGHANGHHANNPP